MGVLTNQLRKTESNVEFLLTVRRAVCVWSTKARIYAPHLLMQVGREPFITCIPL